MNKINLDKLSVKELEELSNEVNKKLNKNRLVNVKVAIDKNQHYIGKCYRKKIDNGYKYIMVVSALSSNEYYLDCLTFNSNIKIERTISEKMTFSINDVFQPIDYQGIFVEDIGLLCKANSILAKPGDKVIDTYEQITKEDFYLAMDNYIKDLKECLDKNKFNDLSSAEHYIKYYQ